MRQYAHRPQPFGGVGGVEGAATAYLADAQALLRVLNASHVCPDLH